MDFAFKTLSGLLRNFSVSEAVGLMSATFNAEKINRTANYFVVATFCLWFGALANEPPVISTESQSVTNIIKGAAESYERQKSFEATGGTESKVIDEIDNGPWRLVRANPGRDL